MGSLCGPWGVPGYPWGVLGSPEGVLVMGLEWTMWGVILSRSHVFEKSKIEKSSSQFWCIYNYICIHVYVYLINKWKVFGRNYLGSRFDDGMSMDIP